MQASFIILQSPFHRNILLPCYANKLLKRLMSSLLESYRPACIQIVCSCTCTAATIDTIQLCYTLQQQLCPLSCYHNAFVPLWQIKPFLKLFLCLFSTPLPNCVVVCIISNVNAKKLGRTMQHKKYFRILSLLFALSCQFMKVFWSGS